MQKNLLIITLFTILYSCNVFKSSKLENASWILGTWCDTSDQITIIEKWSPINDSTFISKSIILEEKDTVSKEFARIEQRNGKTIYLGFFNNQDKNKPAIFKLVVSSLDSIVFENANFAFPQKITYRKISRNILESEISGNSDGEFIIEKFQMGRVK